MLTRLTRVLGWRGNVLALYRGLGWIPFPLQVPIFGTIGTAAELTNLHDNFAAGELRDPQIEGALRAEPMPVVVDCGINVGITVRWWRHLNPEVTVFGCDMLQEAHDMTVARLPAGAAYVPFTAALGDHDGTIDIGFDDPLDGENRVDAAGPKRHHREVPLRTLDQLLRPHALQRIALLKVDIEGQGHRALAGAPETLRVTEHVVLEVHSAEELGASNALLCSCGFRLRRFRNRNLWYDRA